MTTIQVFSFKNVGNAMDISRCRNGHLKQQELQKSGSNLGFKYHGLSRLN
jgi:hypothetical protein